MRVAGAQGAARRSEGRRHALVVVLLAQLAFGLVLLLHFLGPVPALERPIYDAFLRQLTTSEAPDPNIVILEYTEADEARYGYPLPDPVLAELLERLREARPLAIGLDLIRDRPEPRDGDPAGYQRLVAALTADDSIIGIVMDTDAGFGPPSALAERPIQLGAADVVTDPDGVVRRGLLFLTTPVGTRPSFALQLAGRRLLADGIEPAWQGDRLRLGATEYVRLRPRASSLYGGAERAVDDGGYQFLLTFPACPSAHRRINVAEVLDGADGELDLGSRLVLIGNTVPLAKDRFEVPADCVSPRPGEMFGVDLHAQIASQLIRQAHGTARPVETLAQRLDGAIAGQAAGFAWIWLWCMLGGLVAMLVGSPVRLALVATTVTLLIVGAGAGAMLGAGLWMPMAGPLLGAAGSATLAIAYVMTRAKREREDLMRLFSASVSGPVADALWKARSTLTGRGRPPPKLMMATVLFSDIRAFSTISTMLPETRLATWLDLYMAAMADIVERHGGAIEKFAGDGLTASFGVPEPRETDEEIAADARAAVDCALAMAESLTGLNRAMAERDLPRIAIRVGIHSGPLMAGVIGGERRWQYSIIGDTANTAARLESYGKDDPRLGSDADHCRILISEATFHLLDGRFAADPVGSLEMRNRGPIEVYRITGRRSGPRSRSGG